MAEMMTIKLFNIMYYRHTDLQQSVILQNIVPIDRRLGGLKN